MSLSTSTIYSALSALGWPLRLVEPETATVAFQQGWNLGPALRVDGIVGRYTWAAIQTSLARLDAGLGTASGHFSFREFRCRCGGTLPGCAAILLRRELLFGLEHLRAAHYPRGLSVRSGYRCPKHNAQQGGKPDSQHLYGAAADVDQVAAVADVQALQVFSGIGYEASSGLVRHVDVRHAAGHNGTDGTPAAPTTWPY